MVTFTPRLAHTLHIAQRTNHVTLNADEQRELIDWFCRHRREAVMDILCENCPEHIETSNYNLNVAERGKRS